jgi:hypothetical protein
VHDLVAVRTTLARPGHPIGVRTDRARGVAETDALYVITMAARRLPTERNGHGVTNRTDGVCDMPSR